MLALFQAGPPLKIFLLMSLLGLEVQAAEKPDVAVTARITRYAPNALADNYGPGHPRETFDLLSLTILTPSRLVKKVLRVGIPEAQRATWQRRHGVVEFTLSVSDLDNALKPGSSYQLFEGALQKVKVRR